MVVGRVKLPFGVACLAFAALAACGRSERDGEGALVGAAGKGGDAGVETIDIGSSPSQCQLGMSGEGCQCAEVIAGGPRRCYGRYATPCMDERDECCTGDDCGGGACVRGSGLATPTCCEDQDCPSGSCVWQDTVGYGFCPDGVPTDAYNHCLPDQCASDADCPEGFCSLAGTLTVRTCIQASCRSDADCSLRAEGRCLLVNPGCHVPGCSRYGADIAVAACVYPGDGCVLAIECPEGSACSVRDGVAACRYDCVDAGG